MHCQCHFGEVKLCSSVDTTAAAMLRYAIHPTGSDAYHMRYDRLQTRLMHQKSAILECIPIPQLGLINWRCYQIQQLNTHYYYHHHNH